MFSARLHLLSPENTDFYVLSIFEINVCVSDKTQRAQRINNIANTERK